MKVAGKLTTIEILLLAAATLFLAAVGAQYIHTARRAADVPWEIVTGRGDAAVLTPGEPELLDLNTATAEQLQTLPGIGQVLAGRIVEHRQAQGPFASVEELLELAKTKRYAYTRLQRMVLWAYLGLCPSEFPVEVPYLRVLAANSRGREVLARMRKTASLPVLTKSADVRQLSAEAQRLFELEVRATDLYTLAYPDLTAADGGAEWREGPVISR